MIRNDFFANGQANAGSGILALAVQSLEDLENTIGILLVKANAIIEHVDAVVGGYLPGKVNRSRQVGGRE